MKGSASRVPTDASPGVCLLAIDIDRITSTVGLYGDQAIKSVIRQIGDRLNTWIGGQATTISGYRVWADRFFSLSGTAR